MVDESSKTLSYYEDKYSIVPDEMPLNKVIQGVYAGFDSRNGEAIYVGLTENMRTRIYQHMQQLKRRSKVKEHWDEDFKENPNLIVWKALEITDERSILNQSELMWWRKLSYPRFNLSKISSKNFKTGGDTKKKFPGREKLRELRASKMTAIEMAELLGVTKSSVYGWFRNMGEPLHDSSLNTLSTKTKKLLSVEENLNLVLKEVSEGKSVISVCRKYNLSRGVLTQMITDSGYTPNYFSHYSLEELVKKFPKEIIEDLIKNNSINIWQLSRRLGMGEKRLNVLLSHYGLDIELTKK